MARQRNGNRQHGFLIEVIIAIIIITVFALMLVPGLKKWVNKTISNNLFKDAVSTMKAIEGIAEDPDFGKLVKEAKDIKKLSPEVKEKLGTFVKLSKIANAEITWEFKGDKLSSYNYETAKYKISYDGSSKKWTLQKKGNDEITVANATVFLFEVYL